MIEVLDPGGLTTIQDLGRRGLAHLGVPGSGAADREALGLANRLVGNPEDAPALETTLRGPVLRFGEPAFVALTGAPAEGRAGGRDLARNAPERVAAGDELRIGVAPCGVRTYVAVRGGLGAERVLGSAATDLLTGLGPAPLRAGDVLAVGPSDADWRPAPVDVAPVPDLGTEPVLRVVLGPRDDWFAPGAAAELLHASWEVAAGSNRVGVRLQGPKLARARTDELASEGMLPGALQVPPSGQPILLLADHPTTGGYPVLAVVVTEDVSRAGQLRPGDRVRFTSLPA